MENDRNFSAKKKIFNEKKIFGRNFPNLRRKSSWHKFVARDHGFEPRTFTMVFYHGILPWKFTMVFYHGFLENYHGKLP